MGVSKPRKHGLYTGGRSWPLVCPVCRNCQGGAPTHYYNSRGLCNIDHKQQRRAGQKNKWPDLPVMLREGSLKALVKNPLLWLRQNMSDTHAQTIPPQYYELEGWRIIHIMAARWYGEPVYIDPQSNVDCESTVWSRSADGESEEHAPIYDPDRAVKNRKARAAAAKRARMAKVNPLRYEHVNNIIKPFVAQMVSNGIDLPIPKVVVTPVGWAAVWYCTLALTGDLHCEANTITIEDHETGDLDEIVYTPENFTLALELVRGQLLVG